MRIILFIIRKEFRQIFRNKAMLPIIFIIPMIQLLILSNAATFEIQNINIVVVDDDNTVTSHRLISKLEGSPYFNLQEVLNNRQNGLKKLDKGQTNMVLEIPLYFEKNITNHIPVKLQLSADAIDGVKAGLGSGYIQSIVSEFGNALIQVSGQTTAIGGVRISYSYWYNENLDYKTFMVPGILVLLITMIGSFLSGMNIVREKEIGTIEQLNVTPIKKHQFIIGKLFPFIVIGIFELSFGLALARIIFHTPFIGSFWLIIAFALVYMLVVLGIGLLISTITDTQQQAMFISWFFMVIFILMSGLFTPIENMPLWAQKITLFNPIRYFIEVMRMVMLKGAGFQEIKYHFLIVGGYGVALLSLATWRYRKTT
ncbi:MAG: ABC transporter permease [Bacteroidetes bacterium]|nr:ABC transporter permease [Bacteroidota bacterium]MCH8232968.1 ABC transporter permease [Bacteroidota bacterium]